MTRNKRVRGVTPSIYLFLWYEFHPPFSDYKTFPHWEKYFFNMWLLFCLLPLPRENKILGEKRN